MSKIEKLIELLRELPGVGPRQARRIVYQILLNENSFAEELAEEIKRLKSGIAVCPACFRFFEENGKKLCDICGGNRDKSLLMIVSKDIDLENMEKSRSYNGLYFVLGGLAPILEKNPEEKIRQKELVSSLPRLVKDGLKEVILALSVNPEGEHTADYLLDILKPLAGKLGLKISSLGKGLSTGLELEYSDAETLKNAVARRSIK